MRIAVLAIGRIKTGPEQALCAEYLERARKTGAACGLAGFEATEGPERGADQEAQWLLGKLTPGAIAVALDERGDALSSQAFADLIAARRDTGAKSLAFLIGGPDGHGAAVRREAHHIVSFGPMTWPHRLARVMLAEQIYRSVTMMVSHPYHRS